VGQRILVVDDDTDVAESSDEALRAFDHEVCVVNSGAGALALLQGRRAAPIAVALIDLDMPVMDGYALARRIRERGEPIMLIAVSGYGTASHVERALAAGFDRHTTKPLQLDELMALVRSF
jgi:CheY-like chemotaxis protein